MSARLTEQQYAEVVTGRKVGRIHARIAQAEPKAQKGAAGQGRQSTKLQATEAQIQASILQWLAFKGIPHTQTEAKRSFNERGQLVRRVSPGWPDITACWRGTLVGIECKSARGKLRYEQARTLSRLWQVGAIVVVARCIEDVEQAMTDGEHAATKGEIRAALMKGQAPAAP